MNMADVKKFISAWADENKQDFYEAARKIWEIPELSMQEYESCEVLIHLLEKNGFQVEKGVAGMPTAFIASYGSGDPVIGINVEYDALPGLSQKPDVIDKEAITENAPGHGCGHNLLGTGMVKAGIGIKEALDHYQIAGTIKLFGMPAEELCLGKPLLGKSGRLAGVDAFLDWHPWSYNRADYDSCCAYFSVKYHFSGRTCHGNAPWHGRSALDAAILQSHGVEMLREHIYPGCPPDAANTINYTFTSTGPEFPSVVPDKTTAWYIGRFITTSDAQNALQRITDCARGAALATATEVEIELITATNHKIPNKTLAEVVHRNFAEIGCPLFSEKEHEIAKTIQKKWNVAETGLSEKLLPFSGGYSVVCDTSEYSWNAPYATAWVSMAPENIGWHNWGVTLCAIGEMGKKSMDSAAKIIAASAIELFLSPQTLQAAQAEWKERLGGQPYQCLLPDDYEAPIHLNKETMKKYARR